MLQSLALAPYGDLMTLDWWLHKQLAQTTCARTASRVARVCKPTIADAIVASDITSLMAADRGVDEISEALEKSLQAWTANDGWGKNDPLR